MKALNPRFKLAYALSKQIPKRKDKRAIILKWCEAAKQAIGAR